MVAHMRGDEYFAHMSDREIDACVRRVLAGYELRTRACRRATQDSRLRREVVLLLRPPRPPRPPRPARPARPGRAGEDAKEVLDLKAEPARQAPEHPPWAYFDRAMTVDPEAPPVAKDAAIRAALPHLVDATKEVYEEALRQLGLWARKRGVASTKRPLKPGGKRVPCLVGVALASGPEGAPRS
jgi:hypothetical protein